MFKVFKIIFISISLVSVGLMIAAPSLIENWVWCKIAMLLLFVVVLACVAGFIVADDAEEIHDVRKALGKDCKENAPAAGNSKGA